MLAFMFYIIARLQKSILLIVTIYSVLCYIVTSIIKKGIFKGAKGTMDKLLSGIAILVVLILVGVSSFMNYEYFIRWGNTPSSKLALGILTVCIDILKALSLVFIVWAWRNKNYAYVTFAAIFFPFFVIASVAFATTTFSTF